MRSLNLGEQIPEIHFCGNAVYRPEQPILSNGNDGSARQSFGQDLPISPGGARRSRRCRSSSESLSNLARPYVPVVA